MRYLALGLLLVGGLALALVSVRPRCAQVASSAKLKLSAGSTESAPSRVRRLMSKVPPPEALDAPEALRAQYAELHLPPVSAVRRRCGHSFQRES